MKTIGVFFLYFVVAVSVNYLLWDDTTVKNSLISGAMIGVIGAAIYWYQRVRKPKGDK